MEKKKSTITPRTVHVLSVRQPHADQIIFGDKFCENRTWRTQHRGTLYIHASRWDGTPTETDGNGTTGAIIGRCQLVGCVSDDDMGVIYKALFTGTKRRAKPKSVPEQIQGLMDLAIAEDWTVRSFNRHAHGPFCFILAGRQPLANPVLAKGKLNIWEFSLPADNSSQP